MPFYRFIDRHGWEKVLEVKHQGDTHPVDYFERPNLMPYLTRGSVDGGLDMPRVDTPTVRREFYKREVRIPVRPGQTRFHPTHEEMVRGYRSEWVFIEDGVNNAEVDLERVHYCADMETARELVVMAKGAVADALHVLGASTIDGLVEARQLGVTNDPLDRFIARTKFTLEGFLKRMLPEWAR